MSSMISFEKKLAQRINWFTQRRLRNVTVPVVSSEFLPNSLEDAYAVQQEVVKMLGWTVGGWKLGGTNAATREKFNCKVAYYGPISHSRIIHNENENHFEWCLPGIVRAEAEVSFRLCKSPNLEDLKSAGDVLSCIDFFAPALEFPFCTIPNIEEVGLVGLVGDLCGSGYLVLGKSIPIKDIELMYDQTIEITQNDECITRGSTLNIIGTPLRALYEFFNLAIKHKLPLKEGQWIATGGCTPCVNLEAYSAISAQFMNAHPLQFSIGRSGHNEFGIK